MIKGVMFVIILWLSFFLFITTYSLIGLDSQYTELEQNYGFCMDTLDYFMKNPDEKLVMPKQRDLMI